MGYVPQQEFSTKALPARSMVLAPILPAQGIAMAFAPRGVGKTHVALNAAYTVAEGGSFLRWHAPEPRKVLYIDGEMPATALQERLNSIQTASPPIYPENFRLLPMDLQELGASINLAQEDDQRACSAPQPRRQPGAAGQRRAGVQQAGANVCRSGRGAEALSQPGRADGQG